MVGVQLLIPWVILCHSLHRCRKCDEQHRVSAVDPGDRQAGGSHWKSMWETGQVPWRRETLAQDAAVSPFSVCSPKSVNSGASSLLFWESLTKSAVQMHRNVNYLEISIRILLREGRVQESHLHLNTFLQAQQPVPWHGWEHSSEVHSLL